MTDQGHRAMESAQRLRAALDEAAGALSRADLNGLLASESSIEAAIRGIGDFSGLPAEERAVIRHELTRAQIALQRCRRFGGLLLDVVRLTLEAQGRAPGYSRHDASSLTHLSTVNARV
jgi:hypothetical protein